MAITDLDEQLLVRAHQAGDEHAFGQIVRSQHRALYAHAYRRLGNHEAAEDAVQDTLLRAYRALPSFDGDLRLRAWLHRILTNVCHDESNRRKRASGLIDRLEAQPVELAPDPIEETVLHDTVRVMNEALAELPDSYREALVLRYVDGLSFREVAAATGVSEENARARVHRGRIALNKALSRVTVMLAFLIPGLRGRAEKALDADALSSATAAVPAISLSTRLATHVSTAAPVLDRVAVEGSTYMAAKTSVVATAVAAVAAVAAPVAAYKVYDTAQRPTPPPAAVAAPADAPPAESPDELAAAASPDGPRAPVVEGAPLAPDASTTSSSSTSTPTTLPQSAIAPFVGSPPDDRGGGKPSATTTTSTTIAPSEPQSGAVAARIGGQALTVEGGRPDFALSGQVAVESEREATSGALAGDVYVADVVGGDASAELDLTLEDGAKLRFRFRGVLSSEVTDESGTTWVLHGDYRAIGGERLGVADLGTATITFRYVDGAPSGLDLDVHGKQSE